MRCPAVSSGEPGSTPCHGGIVAGGGTLLLGPVDDAPYPDGTSWGPRPAQIPKAHQTYAANGTMPWELEHQIRFHIAAVQSQLEQAYSGFALALALNRTLILPEMRCFCDKNWCARFMRPCTSGLRRAPMLSASCVDSALPNRTATQ